MCCSSHSGYSFIGQCTAYALFKILPGYKKSGAHEFDLLGSRPSQIINQYFIQTRDPQPGDLAVYSNSQGERKHMGIYIALELIESKWGNGPVFRHPPFYVDPSYGNTITFYRLVPDAQFIPNKDIDSCRTS